MRQKKRYSQEQKALFLRELLINKTLISSLAEKYDIHPNVIYSWEKALF
ncbi:MAG: transposase [Ignavibacteriaceae bacterium]|nr:transposase [Ignavibacteriaceae bacterium]